MGGGPHGWGDHGKGPSTVGSCSDQRWAPQRSLIAEQEMTRAGRSPPPPKPSRATEAFPLDLQRELLTLPALDGSCTCEGSAIPWAGSLERRVVGWSPLLDVANLPSGRFAYVHGGPTPLSLGSRRLLAAFSEQPRKLRQLAVHHNEPGAEMEGAGSFFVACIRARCPNTIPARDSM